MSRSDKSTTGVGLMTDFVADTRAMIGFSTRLPIRFDQPVMPRALRSLPIAGVVVGIISASAGIAALAVALPPLFAALLAVATAVATTGALHEDGLADVADGFGGGGDRAAKLAIMRDSRIGTYGVVALVLALAARIVLLGHLADSAGALAMGAAIIVAATLSRAAIVHLFTALGPARDDGLGRSAGRPKALERNTAALQAVIIAVLLIVPTLGFSALGFAVLLTGVGLMIMVRLAERQIGGQTGDVGGAVQQCCEVAVLTALALVV